MVKDQDAEARSDRSVDVLLDAADAEALRAADAHALPPFAAVLARAHGIDPTTVEVGDLGATPQTLGAAPVADADAVLASLIHAARRAAQAGYAAQAPPVLAPRPRRRAWAAVGAATLAMAAAAALLLVWTLRSDAAHEAQGSETAGLAASHVQPRNTAGFARPHTPPSHAPTRPRTSQAPRVQHAPLEATRASPPDAPPPWGPPALPDSGANPTLPGAASPRAPSAAKPDGATDTAPAGAPTEIQRHRRATAGPTRSRLAQLDTRARSALADGDLAAADAHLKKLIRIGGRDRLVEAAFGDRFALAHRLHSGATQRKQWRAYLDRFPGGRFADDARAGLCRRSADDGLRCWRTYLGDFPSGAYRAQATRALDTARKAEP